MSEGNFISQFVDFYKEYESPTSFWKWSCYATVSAILRSKVYFSHGKGRVYPNIYVILLADSAEYRKGAPVKAAKKLLSLTKCTKVYTGTASIQGILEELSMDIAEKGSSTPIRGGSSLIAAEELAAFFVQDPRLIPLLTDIWDYYEEYPYKLKSASFLIKDMCTTMLSASNDTFLREVYDSRAAYGGLLGRTFLVKPDETRRANSLMCLDEEGNIVEALDADYKPLTDSIFKIKNLSGAVRIDLDARRFYDKWYKELYASYKTHPDRTGVIQRIHTNVLKVAILLAAANYELTITKEIFEQAVIDTTALSPNYNIYVMGTGKSNTAELGMKFLAWLYEQKDHKGRHKDFVMKYWADMNSLDEFREELITKLQAGEIIKPCVFIEGPEVEVGYELTEKGRAALERKLK